MNAKHSGWARTKGRPSRTTEGAPRAGLEGPTPSTDSINTGAQTDCWPLTRPLPAKPGSPPPGHRQLQQPPLPAGDLLLLPTPPSPTPYSLSRPLTLPSSKKPSQDPLAQSTCQPSPTSHLGASLNPHWRWAACPLREPLSSSGLCPAPRTEPAQQEEICRRKPSALAHGGVGGTGGDASTACSHSLGRPRHRRLPGALGQLAVR